MDTHGIPSLLHPWGILRFADGKIEQNPIGICRELSDAMRRVDRELRDAHEDDITALGIVCRVPVNEPIELHYEPPRLVWLGVLREIGPHLHAVAWVRE